MRLPRDISGTELSKRISKFGYVEDRQTGSHIRMTTQREAEHHVTIPSHDPLKVGTLSAILRDVASHHHMTRDELQRQLFG